MKSIALGTATDPYQPAERRYEVTRSILEEFARHRGFELGIVTKSNLIVRDRDLLREVARRTTHCRSTSPITTLNVELARILEPRAPRPDLRMDAVRQLHEAGIEVGVSCSPVLPGHHGFSRRSGSGGEMLQPRPGHATSSQTHCF